MVLSILSAGVERVNAIGGSPVPRRIREIELSIQNRVFGNEHGRLLKPRFILGELSYGTYSKCPRFPAI
jgi:hypothetical protein